MLSPRYVIGNGTHPTSRSNIEQQTTKSTGELMRVLLVEGSPIFSQITVLLLERHYRNHMAVVGMAHDGADAMAKAIHLCPHVILLDLCVPGTKHLDVIPRLRKMLPHTRIIALGLLDTEGSRQAALAAGAHDFIPKAMLNRSLMPLLQHECEVGAF